MNRRGLLIFSVLIIWAALGLFVFKVRTNADVFIALIMAAFILLTIIVADCIWTKFREWGDKEIKL